MGAVELFLTVIFAICLPTAIGVNMAATTAVEFRFAESLFYGAAVSLALAYISWLWKRWQRPATTISLPIVLGLVVMGYELYATPLFLGWVLDKRTNADTAKAAPPTASEIARELGGGDNFCFLSAEIDDPPNLTASFQLYVNNSRQRFIPHVEMWVTEEKYGGDSKKPGYRTLLKYEGPCHPATATLGPQAKLPPSEYRVDISGSTGSLTQILRVVERDGKIVALPLEIYRNGKRLDAQ